LGSNSERQLSAPEGVRREVAGVAAAYYGSAKLGLDLAFETTSVTAVWPPTGIALAAVVLCGYRIWPSVALGALLANGWTGVPLYAVLEITVGNNRQRVLDGFVVCGAGRDWAQLFYRPSSSRTDSPHPGPPVRTTRRAGVTVRSKRRPGLAQRVIGGFLRWRRRESNPPDLSLTGVAGSRTGSSTT
jgi:MASE1